MIILYVILFQCCQFYLEQLVIVMCPVDRPDLVSEFCEGGPLLSTIRALSGLTN